MCLVDGRIDHARLDAEAERVAGAFRRPVDEVRQGIAEACRRMAGTGPDPAAPREWVDLPADLQERVVAAVAADAQTQHVAAKRAVLALVRGAARRECPDLRYSADVGELIAERVVRQLKAADAEGARAAREAARPALDHELDDAVARLWAGGKKDKVYLRNISRVIGEKYGLDPFSVAWQIEARAARPETAGHAPAAPGTVISLLGGDVVDWRQLADPLSETVLGDGAMREYRFLAVDGGSDNVIRDLYVYRDGVYRSRGEETIRAHIASRAEQVAQQVYETTLARLRKEETPPALAKQQAAQEADKCRRAAGEAMTEKVVYRIETAWPTPS